MVAKRSCSAVAPLLARYNDPELNEAEQVLLSMHLLSCPACLARLQEYRALDQRVRTMSSTTLAPAVRDAFYQQIALTANGDLLAFAVPWRQAWASLAVLVSMTTVFLAAGLTMALAAQRSEGSFGSSPVTRSAMVRPFADTMSQVNPTAVVENPPQRMLSASIAGVSAQATRPAAAPATIQSFDLATGRLTVSRNGAGDIERCLIQRDTALLHTDGSPVRLAELAVGSQIRLQCETTQAGILVARELLMR